METAATSGGWRRRIRRAVAAVAALLLLLLLWTAWALLASRSDLQQARDAVRAANDQRTLTQGRAALDRAAALLQHADNRLSGLGPRIISRVPVLGRTPEAARVSTAAALAAAQSGQRVLAVTDREPDLFSNGRIDLAGLARVSAALRQGAADVRQPVRAVDRLDTGLTPGPVGSGVTETRDALHGLPQTLSDGADALDALARLAGRDQPRHILLALENNAELRGTGGIVTVFAEATAQGGRVTVSPFRDVDDVADPAARARRVPAPADYTRLWGPYLANSTLWKNTNMSPDIPTSSAVLARVAEVTLGQRPDAVVWLDVPSLAAVIGATSDARLPDGTVLTRDNTVAALLSDAYAGAVDTRAGQRLRRARLRGAADAVADRLLRGHPQPDRISLALAEAARGRHLALWSAFPREQSAFVRAGVAGAMAADGGDLASMTVQNFGGGDREGNKLDYYARRDADVHVQLDGTAAEVDQQFTLRNDAPPRGLPTYVAGAVAPGTSNNFVTIAVPRGARLHSFTRGGQPVRTELLPEGDHAVLTDALSLPPGTAVTWRLRYRLPVSGRRYVLHLIPQPLAVDARVHWQVTGAGGWDVTADAGRTKSADEQAFSEERTVRVHVARASPLRRLSDAVRRFWSEPVHLPF